MLCHTEILGEICMENIPGAGTPGEGLLKFFTAGLRGQAAGLCAKDMEGGGRGCLQEGPMSKMGEGKVLNMGQLGFPCKLSPTSLLLNVSPVPALALRQP